MKLIKKIISSPDFIALLVVVFFGILASYPLLGKGYFNMHDDLQMMRQLEMEKCILDGQIPCRWVPDMGYGFGFPLFNFYPPLPYLVGQGIRALGYDFVSSAKGIFVVAFVASGISMYYLGKQFFGRLGGILSAGFYVWAPYHALDVYVRGAANESWAMVFFPLILWIGYRLIKEKKNNLPWIVGLALSWFGLLTSHNLMVLVFTPVFGVWCLIWLFREKAWKKIPQLLISGIFALGLAAFFTIPALVENKYTHVSSVLSGYYDYSGHFATINQILFSRFWGFGASIWLEDDGMSFQVGHIHWISSIIVIAIVAYNIFKKKKLDELSIIMVFMFMVGWVATFLIHSRSTPVWLAVTPLRYLQFPWRFLVLPTFCYSLMIGSVVKILPGKIGKYLPWILIIGLIAFDWNYFKPEHGKLGNLTDETKFTAAAWELQQTAGIWDYLPATAEMAPREPMKYLGEAVKGKADVTETSQGTNWANFKVNVLEDETWVRVGIMNFPGWKALVDGKEVKIEIPYEEKWGRMWLAIPKGEHSVEVRFHNTPVRTISNIISLASWVTLLSFPFWSKKTRIV